MPMKNNGKFLVISIFAFLTAGFPFSTLGSQQIEVLEGRLAGLKKQEIMAEQPREGRDQDLANFLQEIAEKARTLEASSIEEAKIESISEILALYDEVARNNFSLWAIILNPSPEVGTLYRHWCNYGTKGPLNWLGFIIYPKLVPNFKEFVDLQTPNSPFDYKMRLRVPENDRYSLENLAIDMRKNIREIMVLYEKKYGRQHERWAEFRMVPSERVIVLPGGFIPDPSRIIGRDNIYNRFS
jgi:hypothetical protein